MDAIKFLLILIAFCITTQANAQTPPYGQTIGSLPTTASLNGADFGPIVQNGKDFKAPISQIASFLGQPQGGFKDIQFNNGGIFGGNDLFVFDGYAVGLGINSPRAGTSLDIGMRTDSIILPSGTTGQEPVNPINGMIRYNVTNNTVEAYFNGRWNAYGSGGPSPPPVGDFITTESSDIITTESGDGLVTE